MSSEPDETFDIFLSHAHAEAEAVESIAVKLEDEYGLRVWLDSWILIPGEHWQQKMARGLDQAKTCAVCIGGSNTPSGWFREEIERALNRQTKDQAFRVIPVILPNGDHRSIDDFLELRTRVDFTKELENADAFRILVSGVRGVPREQRRRDETQKPPGTSHDKISNELPAIRFFRGRRDLLAQIGESLVKAAGRIVLTGMPTVGKTQCAIQYALQHKEDWDLRWWIPADNKLAIDTAYVQLAKRLNVEGAESPSIKVIIDGVKKWLKGHSRMVADFRQRRVWRHQSLHTEPIRLR